MRYIVECRKRLEDGSINAQQYRGFGSGLPNKSIANKVFKEQVSSGTWDAVYLEKLYDNGGVVEDNCWYKEPNNAY